MIQSTFTDAEVANSADLINKIVAFQSNFFDIKTGKVHTPLPSMTKKDAPSTEKIHVRQAEAEQIIQEIAKSHAPLPEEKSLTLGEACLKEVYTSLVITNPFFLEELVSSEDPRKLYPKPVKVGEG
eukprot:TRINITY_DN1068_c0_g2_i1.p1 TRINITY_DN1068_c0_g2~~TRINITY_DN1068_c0_g2_i1.p1  ORF type:complete len:126 (-),score=18.82 TRINITY_DN1068_c0_g2_i1:297-674(-)